MHTTYSIILKLWQKRPESVFAQRALMETEKVIVFAGPGRLRD